MAISVKNRETLQIFLEVKFCALLYLLTLFVPGNLGFYDRSNTEIAVILQMSGC